MNNTKEIKLGNVTLECRLDGKAVWNAEKALNKSLLNLFVDGDGKTVFPPIGEVLVVLQRSNKRHGVSEKDVLDGFEQFLDQGGTTMDLYNDVSDLMKEAGFFGKQAQENAKTTSESEKEQLSLVQNKDEEETKKSSLV